MLSVYNAQYDDYILQAQSSEMLTEGQKEVMREKKKILTEVHPMILMYAAYADTGTIPDMELEAVIITKLNQLLLLLLTN